MNNGICCAAQQSMTIHFRFEVYFFYDYFLFIYYFVEFFYIYFNLCVDGISFRINIKKKNFSQLNRSLPLLSHYVCRASWLTSNYNRTYFVDNNFELTRSNIKLISQWNATNVATIFNGILGLWSIPHQKPLTTYVQNIVYKMCLHFSPSFVDVGVSVFL